MLKIAFAGLLIVSMVGCATMQGEQSCALIRGTAATTTAVLTEGQDTTEVVEVVEGVTAAIELIEESVTDSTALEVLSLIQCATEGVTEGLQD